MTPDEFKTACNQACEYCAAGHEPRLRTDTGEHVHDFIVKASFSHTICQADGIRKTYEAQQQNG